MSIRFTKMHGLGNDFMLIDGVRQSIEPSPEQIATWSRRDIGIGFDQCLLVEPSHTPEIDFFYRIFNANGTEVGQCGNGARCLARFLQRQGLINKTNISVATHTTRMQLCINPDDTVTVDMGIPRSEASIIPIDMKESATWYHIPGPNHSSYPVHAIHVGNPHAVLMVENVAEAPVAEQGRYISEHPLFPEQTNVGFVQIVNPRHILLRVYERGCGETRACGSGAVAAAAVGRLYHDMQEHIIVTLPGGDLQVSWPDTHDSIYLSGPATFVYDGVLESICV